MIVTGMKNQRGSLPTLIPKAAPRLNARVRGTRPPKISMERVLRAPMAQRFVTISRIRIAGRMLPRKKALVFTCAFSARVSFQPHTRDRPAVIPGETKDGEKSTFPQSVEGTFASSPEGPSSKGILVQAPILGRLVRGPVGGRIKS